VQLINIYRDTENTHSMKFILLFLVSMAGVALATPVRPANGGIRPPPGRMHPDFERWLSPKKEDGDKKLDDKKPDDKKPDDKKPRHSTTASYKLGSSNFLG
jgi:hypothetical protein